MPNMVYTLQERVSFVQQFYFGMNAYQIRDRFAAEFPHRPTPAFRTICRIIEKFRETGTVDSSLADYSQVSRCIRIPEEKQFEISAFREELRKHSYRRMASEIGVSSSADGQRINYWNNQQRYTPYKRDCSSRRISLSVEERRMIFCEAFMEECNANPKLIDTICTSSQCNFSLREASVDGQSAWDRSREFDRQVTVWTGMVGDRVIGPFIVDGKKLKAETYLGLLREKIVPAIRNLEQELGQKIYFQQDGTPAHIGRIITDYLNSEFPNRWFGLKTQLSWPTRSPDLNPLDYFYWPRVKENVGRKQFLTLDSLIETFIEVNNQITPDQIREATRSLYHRLTYCTLTEGRYFESYL